MIKWIKERCKKRQNHNKVKTFISSVFKEYVLSRGNHPKYSYISGEPLEWRLYKIIKDTNYDPFTGKEISAWDVRCAEIDLCRTTQVHHIHVSFLYKMPLSTIEYEQIVNDKMTREYLEKKFLKIQWEKGIIFY